MTLAMLRATAVPEHLRGYIGRFLIELDSGVFVGRIAPRVADGIWECTVLAAGTGTAFMVTSDRAQEQGFAIRTTHPERLIDLGGLVLSLHQPQTEVADK